MNAKETSIKDAVGIFAKKGSTFIALLFLVILLAILSPNFFTISNVLNIIRQSAVMGIMAIGMTFVIITGGIDLSVGPIMALSGSLIAVASTQWGVPPFLCVVMGILSGTILGLFNGFIISKAKIQDFIATLGSMTTISGLALLITDGMPISGIEENLLVPGSGKILGEIPISLFIFAAVALFGWVLLEHTTIGRDTLAIGGNREAARVSGISIDGTKIFVYGFSGFCCSIGGIVMIGRLNSANALMGNGMEMLVIASAVLGGTSLAGGIGSIGGTIVGAITIGVLNNGLDLLNVSAFWQKVILGLVIISVVSFDTWRKNKMNE